MNVLVDAVLPIALVALSGVCLGKAFRIDLSTLAKISIYALLPALVITGVYDSSLGLGVTLRILLVFLLNCAVLYSIAIACGHRLKLPADVRKSLVATTLLANTGNIGLPFVLFSVGEAGLARAIVYLVISALFLAGFGPVFLKGEGLKVGLKVTLTLPVLWATLGGLALQVFALQVPTAIDRALSLMGEAAIPIALLTLGIQLSQIRFHVGLYELLAAGLRLGVSPITAYGIGRVVGLEGIDLTVVVLQSAMPVAVNTLIWVTEFGGDTVRVARSIVVTTLLSFVSLPTVLWLITQATH
ncbi:MAG: AEC family transporter [Cyanobacteria bacterium J06627_28]